MKVEKSAKQTTRGSVRLPAFIASHPNPICDRATRRFLKMARLTHHVVVGYKNIT